MMTTLALGFSLSLRMILSNSPVLGSRGIFTDWEMHRSPEFQDRSGDKVKKTMSLSLVDLNDRNGAYLRKDFLFSIPTKQT